MSGPGSGHELQPILEGILVFYGKMVPAFTIILMNFILYSILMAY